MSAAAWSAGGDKRARRAHTIEAKRRREARERRRAAWRRPGLVAIAVAALVGLGYWVLGDAFAPALGEAVPSQGALHVAPGEDHPPYNSKPPTSGWHWGQAPRAGVHSAPLPDELQVHALEHGAVMVQYDCPSGCPELVAQLELVVNGYASKVLLAPYPGLPRPVALTVWGRVLYLDGFDEAKVQQFIRRYKEKGPECTPVCPPTP